MVVHLVELFCASIVISGFLTQFLETIEERHVGSDLRQRSSSRKEF
jgi:hypothetical protein